MKSKLKSEIFNGKNIYKYKYFSVMIKNLNGEISGKNLVIFGLGLCMKSFNIIGVHWKIQFLEGCMKKTSFGGESPKKGGLDSLQI